MKINNIATAFCLLVFLLLGCSSQENKEEVNKTKSPSVEEDKKASSEGKLVTTLTEMPNDLVLLGNQYITGRQWEDKNGVTLVYFTFKEEVGRYDEGMEQSTLTRSLFAEHFVLRNGNTELIREVKDFEKDCAFDNQLYLETESISLTDLDADGFKEVSFVYTLGCRSDVSPDPMKLIMLENNDKYAIRGNTRFKNAPEDGKPEDAKNFDKSFETAPATFKEFASKLWDTHQMK